MIVAIDPGANGAIVSLHEGQIKAIKMPSTNKEIVEHLKYLKSVEPRLCVAIEALQVRPTDFTEAHQSPQHRYLRHQPAAQQLPETRDRLRNPAQG